MAAEPGKTEPATPKRRQKVRSEGNVPKSQEATKTATIIAGFFAMSLYFPFVAERLNGAWNYYFKQIENVELTSNAAHSYLYGLVIELGIICGPIFFLIAFMAFITLRRQVGHLWTTKVFKFNLSKFNIIAGFKRILFSKEAYIRMLKTIALAAVVGYVPYMVIMNEKERFSDLYYSTPFELATYILETSYTIVLYTLIPMMVIAIYDIWHVFHEWEEKNKMSKHEVKDEMKQSEGDPIIKGKQRQKMMEVLKSRMMKQIPTADVIIVNPTHYSVALKYDQTICPAPLVVAKGIDKVALRIREIARENNVPIKENRLLARSLFDSVEIGDPIPEDLYKAVASIIAEIWKTKGKM